MEINEIVNLIETILPPKSAIPGDKIGLQVQSDKQNIKRILIVYEVTQETIEEAKHYNCDLIITFHPLIYYPLNNIVNSDRTGYLVTKLIQSGIALLSLHTTFDTFSEGTSKIFAENLGLEVIGFLEPNREIESSGMGVIALTGNPIKPMDLLERVKKICKSPIKYSSISRFEKINRIGIVGGAGSSYIDRAIELKLDAFITADISYHRFHQAKDKIILIDPGHYEMEKYVPQGIYNLLTRNFELKDIEFIKVSEIITNPVNYY